MPKKMLIDATHSEETRVVVVDGNKVEEFDFETGRGLEASWAVRKGMWRGGGGSGERRGVGGRIGADSRVVGTSVAAR